MRKILVLLVGGLCWGFLWFGTGAVLADAPQQATVALKSYDATRSEPPVVLIQRATPDYAQVCVEPTKNGVVACRPISELRKWIVSPTPPPCPPIVKK